MDFRQQWLSSHDMIGVEKENMKQKIEKNDQVQTEKMWMACL